jgi:polar amino acid transport system substrate-binding protein
MKNPLMILVVLCSLVTQLNASEKIKLCYEDASVFPWITGDNKGLAILELHLIEKMLKVKFELTRLPWKRCQIEAESLRFDGIIAASYNSNRASWGIYPTLDNKNIERDFRMHTDSFYVYTRKDSPIKWSDNKFQNLGKNAIAVQLGYSVANDLVESGHEILSTFTTPYEILKLIDINKMSVAVLQNYETTKTLNDHPKLKINITRSKKPFKTADQYLLFTKDFYSKNETLTKNIWQATKKARMTQEYMKAEKNFLQKMN